MFLKSYIFIIRVYLSFKLPKLYVKYITFYVFERKDYVIGLTSIYLDFKRF